MAKPLVIQVNDDQIVFYSDYLYKDLNGAIKPGQWKPDYPKGPERDRPGAWIYPATPEIAARLHAKFEHIIASTNGNQIDPCFTQLAEAGRDNLRLCVEWHGDLFTLAIPYDPAIVPIFHKITDAYFDRNKKVWTVPATSFHADRIREVFERDAYHIWRDAKIFPQFTERFLSPIIEPPYKSKTTAWAHQKRAYNRAFEKPGFMLALDMGCVAGETLILINRAKNSKKMTLRDLYYKFNGITGRWDLSISCYTKSLFSENLNLNKIQAVLYKGIKEVFEVKLESGKSIRVTSDHEIARPNNNWTAASLLEKGDKVLTNGLHACYDCGSVEKVITKKTSKFLGLCLSCSHSTKYKRNGVHSKTIDKDGYIRINGMRDHHRANNGGQVYEHILVMEKELNRSIEWPEIVHHKNGNKSDNRVENLEVITATEHQIEHRRFRNMNGGIGGKGGEICFIPKIDTVLSVSFAGYSDVYDIVMSDPARNFVANGIIVHNCGKSKIAVDLTVNRDCRRILIVCPKAVIDVWPKQFELHAAPEFNPVILPLKKGTLEQKTAQAVEAVVAARNDQRPLVVIINYESAWREPFRAFALDAAFDCVIADESHKIKAPGGKAALFMREIGKITKWRLALTGTPMPHSPADIYAQYRFLDSSIFGSRFQGYTDRRTGEYIPGFLDEYATGFDDYQRPTGWRQQELNAKIYRIAERVKSTDVLDLPPVQHIEYYFDLESKARKIYNDLDDKFAAMLDDATVSVNNKLTQVLRFAQLTGGFFKSDDGELIEVDSGKRDLLEEILDDLDSNEPVVVFARFQKDLLTIHEVCRKLERGSLELSGKINQLEKWQAGAAPVLAVQIQAGGAGVDCTRACHVIYMSVGYSNGDYEQSLKRADRPGQTRPVRFYHLLCNNSIDIKIQRALEAKTSVVEAILGVKVTEDNHE